MAPTIPNIKLSSGHDMPQVGFGLWKVNNETCADTVYNAIKAGYRLLDGAADYGNEVECGQGVARAIKDGLVKREDLFIVSKLWQTFHEKERVPEACRRSLEDWGLEYFDLYLIHFPAALAYVDPKVRYPPGWQVDGKDTIQWSNATTQETWTAMEGLVASGLSKSIGISNFSAQLIYDMLRYAKIRPATLQIEHHPFYVQPELIRLAKEEGIAVTAYSSFGPASFVEFGWQHAKDFTPLREDPVITTIAEKYGKKPTQVLLRWSTQRGLAVIPKTNRTELLEENMDVIGWDMTQEELDSISAKDRNLKFNKPTNYFTSEKLWLFT